MRVRVRFDPNCRFDIGERTPEMRLLVTQYVKAFIGHLAAHAGRPPGSTLMGGDPPAYVWRDANWRFTYTLERIRGRSVVLIKRVERS
jgi:hypothetical protein